MTHYKYLIGIDISKNHLDVCVLEGTRAIVQSRIGNTEKDLATFHKKLKKEGIVPKNALFCCEHTGIYANHLMAWSARYGYQLWVEKAIQIKRSIGMQRGKSDKIDAQRIAMYAYRHQDKAVLFVPPRDEVQELKHLLTTRRRLVVTKNKLEVPLQELKSQVDDAIYKRVAAASKAALEGVKKAIEEVNKSIQKLIQSDENLSKMVALITSVSGIGRETATNLIAATNEFKTVNSPKELACYVGVAPFSHTSGSSIRGKNRVSHFANKKLKTLTHLCALSAKTHTEEFREYYERKKAEGKHPMSILNAIRNKALQRIYVCVKQERMYEKDPKVYLHKS